MKRNTHVREYLKYFVDLEHPPHFAVMINGAWGSGKTYLVKDFLKRNFDEKKKYIYVSLYGVSSIDDIDAAMMVAAYPILGKKGTKLVGRMARAALKHARFDMDIKLGDLLNKGNIDLFVFDDVERCEVPVNRVLGYVNELVEHEGQKVVLLANESEIVDDNDSDDLNKGYWRFREKLIGKTLEIESDFDAAVEHFLEMLSDNEAKQFLKTHTPEISVIYIQSDINNLRIIQQTLWDFERVVSVLPRKHKKNNRGLIDLMRLFFALSFEIKAGRIKVEHLHDRLRQITKGRMDKKENDEPAPLHAAEMRYAELRLWDTLLSDEILVDVLSRGVVNKQDIVESIESNVSFAPEGAEPAWKVVWWGLYRTEIQFSKAYKLMQKQFKERKFTEIGELMHAVGLQLWLSDVGVHDSGRSEVVADAKKYVDDVYENKGLAPYPWNEFSEWAHDSYDGLGIQESGTEEFKEFKSYLKKKRQAVAADLLPAQGNELLTEMRQDTDLYYRRVCPVGSDDSIYSHVPVLVGICPVEFVDTVLKLHPEKRHTVFRAFKQRYDHGGLGRELEPEKDWLEDVRKRLLKKSVNLPLIHKYGVENDVNSCIDPALRRAENDRA